MVESQETLVVPDVKKDPRYLPTFWNTQSEIVVPIMDETKKRVGGILDAESDKLDAFTEDDRDFLEHAAVLLARASAAPKKARCRRQLSGRSRTGWRRARAGSGKS